LSASPSVLAVTALPIMKLITTNATQPMIARHGCMPLQRPIR
jgi:hypothetical protein